MLLEGSLSRFSASRRRNGDSNPIEDQMEGTDINRNTIAVNTTSLRSRSSSSKGYWILLLSVLGGIIWWKVYTVSTEQTGVNGSINAITSNNSTDILSWLQNLNQKYSDRMNLLENEVIGPEGMNREPVVNLLSTTLMDTADHETHVKTALPIHEQAKLQMPKDSTKLIEGTTETQEKRITPASLSLSPSLVSANATVTASVRGNLGPPSVVVDPSVADWLKDRWQAAQNMQGTPIPGAHWLVLDLPKPVRVVTEVILDFEDAFATNYMLDGSCDGRQNLWEVPLYDNNAKSPKSRFRVQQAKQHVIHRISLVSAITQKRNYLRGSFNQNDSNKGAANDREGCLISQIRLSIRKPATRWGVSLWRFEVYGLY